MRTALISRFHTKRESAQILIPALFRYNLSLFEKMKSQLVFVVKYTFFHFQLNARSTVLKVKLCLIIG